MTNRARNTKIIILPETFQDSSKRFQFLQYLTIVIWFPLHDIIYLNDFPNSISISLSVWRRIIGIHLFASYNEYVKDEKLKTSLKVTKHVSV